MGTDLPVDKLTAVAEQYRAACCCCSSRRCLLIWCFLGVSYCLSLLAIMLSIEYIDLPKNRGIFFFCFLVTDALGCSYTFLATYRKSQRLLRIALWCGVFSVIYIFVFLIISLLFAFGVIGKVKWQTETEEAEITGLVVAFYANFLMTQTIFSQNIFYYTKELERGEDCTRL